MSTDQEKRARAEELARATIKAWHQTHWLAGEERERKLVDALLAFAARERAAEQGQPSAPQATGTSTGEPFQNVPPKTAERLKDIAIEKMQRYVDLARGKDDTAQPAPAQP